MGKPEEALKEIDNALGDLTQGSTALEAIEELLRIKIAYAKILTMAAFKVPTRSLGLSVLNVLVWDFDRQYGSFSGQMHREEFSAWLCSRSTHWDSIRGDYIESQEGKQWLSNQMSGEAGGFCNG